MINIIFIYLCFWVFISSCFIRWVVSLKSTTLPKESIENNFTKQKEQIEILSKEVQRLQLEEAKGYQKIKEDKALLLEKVKLEKELIDKEIKHIQIRPEKIPNVLINNFIKHYENPIKDNDVVNNLYDKAKSDKEEFEFNYQRKLTDYIKDKGICKLKNSVELDFCVKLYDELTEFDKFKRCPLLKEKMDNLLSDWFIYEKRLEPNYTTNQLYKSSYRLYEITNKRVYYYFSEYLRNHYTFNKNLL